jgi:hypothetical protein
MDRTERNYFPLHNSALILTKCFISMLLSVIAINTKSVAALEAVSLVRTP